MEKHLYLIRHGETDYNRRKIIQGSGVDTSLNDFGREQARRFFDQYRSLPLELIITSTLKRTLETVQPFLELGYRHEAFAEINEINWGEHEGQEPQEWMIQAYEEMKQKWLAGNYDARLSGGESAAELQARVSRFVEHLQGRPERHVLVCSHGRTMRCLMTTLKNEPLHAMEQYRHTNTGLYHLVGSGNDWEVVKENDASHLTH